MIIEQLMPSLSPTMEEGTITAWHVAVGDTVSSGQLLAEIQTDKSVAEWESLDGGHVAAILVEAGGHAKVNQVVMLLTSKAGEDVAEAVAAAKAKNEQLATESEPTAPSAAQEPSAKPAPAPAPAAPSTVAARPAGIRISPLAARIAVAQGLDLAQLRGSGPGGRIIKRDVEAAIASGAARPARAAPAETGPRLDLSRPEGPAHRDLALSPTRQVIGRRLYESYSSIPHFTVTMAIDARALLELRGQLNCVQGLRITVNDLIVKGVALALLRHPAVNATFDNGTIRRWRDADISIAVAIPDGLITPILRGAQDQSVVQINAQVRELARRAADGALKPEEYQGGSFTISNLGMYGVEQFAAIINPPQAAILAVGGIADEPVLSHGAVLPGKVLRVTLSADHRVVDGADAAGFLATLRDLLQTPAALLL